MGQDVKYCTRCIFCGEEVGELSSSKNWCEDKHAKLYICLMRFPSNHLATYELPQTHNICDASMGLIRIMLLFITFLSRLQYSLNKFRNKNTEAQVWYFVSDPQISAMYLLNRIRSSYDNVFEKLTKMDKIEYKPKLQSLGTIDVIGTIDSHLMKIK